MYHKLQVAMASSCKLRPWFHTRYGGVVLPLEKLKRQLLTFNWKGNCAIPGSSFVLAIPEALLSMSPLKSSKQVSPRHTHEAERTNSTLSFLLIYRNQRQVVTNKKRQKQLAQAAYSSVNKVIVFVYWHFKSTGFLLSLLISESLCQCCLRVRSTNDCICLKKLICP